VVLIGGGGTSYALEYTGSSYLIIRVTSHKSFCIDGGILKYGNLNSSKTSTNGYHFCVVSGVSASFAMRYVRIEFISDMNSMVYMGGGTLHIEHSNIENVSAGWIDILIEARCSSFIVPVIINLFSLSINNCYFTYNKSSPNATNSGIIYFQSCEEGYPIFLNISYFSLHNSFFERDDNFTYAGAYCFQSNHPESGFCYLLFFLNSSNLIDFSFLNLQQCFHEFFS
jgi:hypothetical protein